MTPKEAATLIGVTDETLFRWRKDGCGPPYSQPSRAIVRYVRDDLIAWMREQQ
ncbi:helix-turn-helix transcriptional regulator [Tateyamaria armeniaca]|uniref:Helix-turn-helix transcriptional regulator n=1 Tax=Tateyamaria armeniaca TaxID=2518930 RepID=A0ABW8UZX6_9RHOB